MRRAPALLAVAAAAALLVTACSSVPETAGGRVTPTPSDGSGASSFEPASPTLIAQADLVECPETDPSVPARDDGLPDITLTCLGDGPDVRLAGLRGEPTVINLWASWCAPCRDELPLFADLAGTGDVRVVGISVEDDPSSGLSLLVDADVHYPSVVDADSATKPLLRWTGLPMTLFVDADGRVTHVERGQITDAAQLDSLVQQHLGVDASP
ncbi:MAG: TlpA family protein disulfide reductase [Candidatus Nanopelagicales bacterium]